MSVAAIATTLSLPLVRATPSYAVTLFHFVGTVKDADGLPLAGALVSDGSQGTTTAANGTYDLAESSTGTFTLNVSRPHSRDASVTVTVTSPVNPANASTNYEEDFALLYLLNGTLATPNVSTAQGPVSDVLTVTSYAPQPGTPGETLGASCVTVTDSRTGLSSPATVTALNPDGSSTWTYQLSLSQNTPEVSSTLSFVTADCDTGTILSVTGTSGYVIDNMAPVIDPLSITPLDIGNTVFASQPLLAKVHESGPAGIGPGGIVFTLTDTTTSTSATYPSISYDQVSGWAKTAPVSLTVGHIYNVAVTATDNAGNSSRTAQSPAATGGGFLATSIATPATQASIPATTCSVGSQIDTSGNKTATCPNVPLDYAATTVTLGGSRYGSAVGYVLHTAALNGAKIYTTVAGQRLPDANAYQSSDPAWAPKTGTMSYRVGDSASGAQTYPVSALNTNIGTLTTKVPAAEFTGATATLYMNATNTNPTTAACADPSQSAGSPIPCAPDPLANRYIVTFNSNVTNVPSTVTAQEAAYAATLVAYLPSPEKGYLADVPYANVAALAADPSVQTMSRAAPAQNGSGGTVSGTKIRPSNQAQASGSGPGPNQGAAPATSASGDSLSVDGVWPADYDPSYVLGTHCYNITATYGGSNQSACGLISVYDATRANNTTNTNNSSTTWVYDACGHLIYSTLGAGWHVYGSNPPYMSSGEFVFAANFQVPTGDTGCYGQWTVAFQFTQTFDDGVQLTSSNSDAFTVYADKASYVAAGYSQATPTGGPIQPSEQYGGCSCGYPTQAQATNYPIDTASGNFWHTFQDLQIPGRGPQITLSRTYNSGNAATSGPFGFGWSDPYAMSLSLSANTVVVNQANGAQATFTLNGSTWSAPPRVQATLVRNSDGTWTFTQAARFIFTFDSTGRLSAIRDLNGYTTSVAYPNASTEVVTDPAGRTLTFAFTGANITSVTDSSSPARTLTYSYDASGNLTDVIDVGGGHWQFTYDSSHRMLTMRSPRFYGNTTTSPSPVVTNTYDSQGRVISQTDQLGRATTFDYTSISGSTKVTDPKGNITVYGYQDGLLVSETRGYGTSQAAHWFYRYDPNTTGRTVVIDPNGNVTQSTYDSAGNLTSTTDALGRTTTHTYDALHDLTSTTEAKQVNGQPVVTTGTYDANGNPLAQSSPLLDANGNTTATATTTYHYGDSSHPGDVTSLVDPNGNQTTFTYDNYGNLTSVAVPPTPENPAGDKTTYGYDALRGWRTSMVSPKGNLSGANPASFTTTYAYDAYGRPTITRDPLWTSANPTKHETINGYDADGNVTSTADADGNVTTYTYDAAGEHTDVHRADSTTLHSDYWPDGTLKDQVDAAGNTTSYTYDPLGHPSAVTDPLGRITRHADDGAGNQLSVTDASGRQTTYSYDPANELTSISYSDGVTPNVTAITYDADGQRISMTDGTGTSTWAYDTLHHLTASTNGAGQTVGYGYDLGGRLTSIAYPGTTGTVTRTYDAANRLTGVQDWAGRQTTFGYDANSNLVTQAYPNGTQANTTVDNANQTAGISDAPTSNPTAPFATFSYSRDGNNQVTAVNSTGVPADNHSYDYTALNQLRHVDSPNYSYDAAGNLTGQLNGTTQAFDAANQLNDSVASPISLVGTADAGDATSSSFTLNLPAGTAPGDQVIVAATLPNGKTENPPSGYTLVGMYSDGTKSHTAAKIVIYRRAVVAGDTSVTVSFKGNFDKTVTLAAYHNVNQSAPIDATATGTTSAGTSLTVPSVNTSLGYERLLLVAGASGATGSWTPPTGMTAQVQAHSDASDGAIIDQALSTPGATGPRTAINSASTSLIGVLIGLKPVAGTYADNAQGDRTSQPAPNSGTTTLTYDQANRLTGFGAIATYRYDGDGLRASKTVNNTTTNFTWDKADSQPLLLSDGNANYIYGPGGTPLEQINGTNVLYYHHDQLGSTRALTNSSGTVVATYTYDSYGNLTGSTGTASNPFGYAGQYADAESGLIYLRARYYDPSSGQFVTRDPIVGITGQPYAYANDDPINNIDPTGLAGSTGQGLYCPNLPNPYGGYGLVLGGAATSCNISGGLLQDLGQVWHDTLGQHWRGTVQIIGAAAGVIALATGVGALADVTVLGLESGSLATISTASGFVASGADIPGCLDGSAASCAGVGANLLGGGLGVLGTFTAEGGSLFGVLGSSSFALAQGSLFWDLLSTFADAINCSHQ